MDNPIGIPKPNYYKFVMKSAVHSIGFIFLLSIIITSCGNEKSEKRSQDKGRVLEPTEKVTFLAKNGNEISTVKVVLADEPEERNQGLMDVNEMPADVGMLFIFPNEEQLNFYMANTPLPLDIIFVNADSTIVRIHHSTTPFSSKQLPSEKPAKYVVETNGGYCISNDIQEGMKIRF